MVFSAMKFSMSPEEAHPLGFAVTSFQVTVSNSTGRTVSFGPLVAMTSDVVRVLWGDGSYTDYTPQNVDSQYRISEAWHTYSADGVYVITVPDSIWELDLTPVTAGSGSSIWAGAFPRNHLVTRLVSVGPHVDTVVAEGMKDLSHMEIGDRVLYCGKGIVLGDYAMSECASVRSLAPLSGIVTSTGKYCFERCTSLTDLSGISGFLPVAEGSFSRCRSLASIAGLDAATAFGDRLFERCTSLTSLAGLPTGLTDLGQYTFFGCTALTSVSPVEQRSITSIPAGCFRGCTGITNIDPLIDRIEAYGPDCFRESGLTRLFYPYAFTTRRAVVSFGDRCFMDTPLASLNMLGTSDQPLTTLGDEVFRGCSYLSSPGFFGWNISSVGDGVFRDCYAEVRDSDGLVVSERGLTGISFVRMWHAYGTIPPYTFYGDARIASLSGLSADGDQYVDKTRYGDFCFAGCNSLSSLAGFPASAVSTTAPEPGRKLPSWPLANLGRGVFMDLYKPPFQKASDAVDPLLQRRPYHYRGLVDASVLASAVQVRFLPPQFMEGCALLEDFPEQPPACRRWGDRCFARCCNMKTLDALARMGVAGDDVALKDAYVVPKMPQFGAECFKDCSWVAVYGDAHVPDQEEDIFDPDPSSPPEHNAGLTRIGGLRVWMDRMELAAVAKTGDASSLMKRRWMYSVSEPLIQPVQLALGESVGSDYYQYKSISEMLSVIPLGDNDVYPLDGVYAVTHDGAAVFSDFTFSTATETGSGCVLAFVTPLYGGQDVVTGVTVDIAGFWITVGTDRRFSCGMGQDYTFSTDVQADEVSSNDYASLKLTGNLVDVHNNVVVARADGSDIEVDFGGSVVSASTGDELASLSFALTLTPGSFDQLTSVDRYKRMTEGYLLAAAAAYSATGQGYGLAYRWDAVGDLLTALGGASSAGDVADALHRALVFNTMSGMDSVLGEGCFEGCRSLAVADSSANTGTELDGFSRFILTIPARCFRDTAVVPSAVFKSIIEVGDYAFAETPTVNLSGYPPEARYIPSGCFAKCSRLTSFGALRNGVSAFGDACFDGCEALADIRSQGLSVADLDSDTSFDDHAQVKYSEFTDKYGYSSLATSLGVNAFRGTSVASLVHEWETVEVDVEDATEVQAFVTSIFDELFSAAEVVPVGRIDGTSSEKEFRLRLRSSADWGTPEIVFAGYADITDVDAPGFNMNGVSVANGCVGSIRFVVRTMPDSPWFPAYTGSDSSGVRYTHAPYAVEYMGFMELGDVLVRVSCPTLFYPSRTSSSVVPYDGDVIRLLVGPYRVDVQVCLSARVTKNSGGVITDIEYELKGVRPHYIARMAGADHLDKVPIFPLLNSVGKGCFENCTSLRSLDGLDRLYTLPSRCFAGCPFEHNVENPDVVSPEVTASMPVYTDRLAWQSHVISAVYLYRSSKRSDGVVTGLVVSTAYSATNQIEIAVSITGGVRSYSVVTDTADPVTYQGETFTPTLVSVDDDKIVVGMTSDFRVKLELDWESDSSYVSISSASVYEDDVASEMAEYLSAFNGSVVALTDSADDFAFDASGLEYTDALGTSHRVLAFSWDRETGEWSTRVVPSLAMNVAGHPGKTVQKGSYPEVLGFNTEAFSCVEHAADNWFVLLHYVVEAVQVLARSVTIPPNVNNIGNDCFTFDIYPDTPPLQAVYFNGKDPTTVRGMTGFPFGVPPGCSIYAGGGVVYTEPLPS